MALTTTKVVRLTFTTSGGGTFAITLANPKEGLQVAEIEAAMDSIIQDDIYLTSSGALTGIRDIKVIGTETDDLYNPVQS